MSIFFRRKAAAKAGSIFGRFTGSAIGAALALAIVLTPVLWLFGPADGSARAAELTEQQKQAEWIHLGKQLVAAKLKDPDSAEFRGVYFHRGSKGVPVTCGEVNSRNGFGGYTGYQRFISAGEPNLTFVEEQFASGDFGEVWRMFCKS